jgi:hypothetical protein
MTNDDDDYPDPSPEELGIGALLRKRPNPSTTWWPRRRTRWKNCCR